MTTDKMIPITRDEADRLLRLERPHHLALWYGAEGISLIASESPWAIELLAEWREVPVMEVLA